MPASVTHVLPYSCYNTCSPSCARWQRFSELALSESSLAQLAQSCDEFLVHGVDVEGMQLGIDDALVELLGRWSPIPVTYAGGARTLVGAGAKRFIMALLSSLHMLGSSILFATAKLSVLIVHLTVYCRALGSKCFT